MTSRTALISEYLQKPYARILTPEQDGKLFVAQILEFPGCIAEGNTPNKAYGRLEKAAAAWIEAVIDSGQPVPEPTFDKIRDYSGKVSLRLPRNIHREAVRSAEQQHTSLNTFLVSSISSAVGAISLYDTLVKMLDRKIARASLLQAIAIAGPMMSAPMHTAIASEKMLEAGDPN